jgi:hypothetical protein
MSAVVLQRSIITARYAGEFPVCVQDISSHHRQEYTHSKKDDHDNNDKDYEEAGHTTSGLALVVMGGDELLSCRACVVCYVDDVALDVVCGVSDFRTAGGVTERGIARLEVETERELTTWAIEAAFVAHSWSFP